MPTLGDLLRLHREHRGLSQEGLAALAQPALSPDTISNLERGRTHPYRHTLEALCQALALDDAGRHALWDAWRAARNAESPASADLASALGRSVIAQPTPLPSGTVTFLLSDVERSTSSWLRQPEAMSLAMARHDILIERLAADHGGRVVRPRGEGDSCFAVFVRPSDALAAACAIQLAFAEEPWPLAEPLRVRMAIHTGETELRLGEYYGPAINHCGRLRGVAHGCQVLVSAVTADLVREALSPGLGLRDLGLHQLKDLNQPEHIWQAVHPDLPDAFPPLTARIARRTNLPNRLSSFVGRERDLIEVRQLVEHGRLVTLTGAGGVGKTRLALQVVADLVDAYADGVWFVELAPVADPVLVPQAVASVLGVQEEPRRALIESLADWLAPRELVLLVDNCEHLVEACAGLVDALLAACPNLRILATSREPLRMAGEVSWRLPSLRLPDPRRLPPAEDLVGYDAIRLFVERAASIKPGFAVTNQNAAALAQVCHRLDGIPLALELAAARVEVLTVEQISARLDERFSLLTGGSRTALPRQQTLRAMVDWSYQLLSAPERAVLRRLAVFAGGGTLDAVEAICSGDGIEVRAVLDLVGALLSKSLVQMEEKDGEARYRLLETVRDFAWEKLRESEGQSIVRRRHMEWFQSVAERAARGAIGPDEKIWADRLETEHDNIRASLEWSAATGADVEAALRQVTALSWFWAQRGFHREGRAWYSTFLARAQGRSAPRAGALREAGYLALRQGDYSASIPLLEESLALCRELGDRAGVTAALLSLGEVRYAQLDFRGGKLLVEEALVLAKELDDWHSLHNALYRLGDIAYDLGEYPQALICYEQMLALCQQHGYPHGIGSGLRGLGQLAAMHGDYRRAKALLGDSLGQFIELKDKRCTARCLQALALVASGLGQPERVARLLGAAEALRKAVGLEELPTLPADAERASAARAAIGEATFAARWAEGRRMSLAEAADYALSAEASRARHDLGHAPG